MISIKMFLAASKEQNAKMLTDKRLYFDKEKDFTTEGGARWEKPIHSGLSTPRYRGCKMARAKFLRGSSRTGEVPSDSEQNF